MKPGAWLIVAGGWNVQQFKEKRLPSQADLIAAAPDNPVYVQPGYGCVVMNPAGLRAMRITTEADLPPGGRFEKDADGKPNGAIVGSQNAIIALFDKLPKPSMEEQIDGTKQFFRELNRLGITGFVDPGGNNVSSSDYAAIFKVWRDGQMSVRVAFALNGLTPGVEFEEYRNLTRLLPMGFGDDMLKFNGIGERITSAMNNNDKPGQSDKERYYEIIKWAAERGMALTMHWNRDASVDELLSLFEKLNKEIPSDELAMVDRAPERCFSQKPATDESTRHGMDCAGRHVLRR